MTTIMSLGGKLLLRQAPLGGFVLSSSQACCEDCLCGACDCENGFPISFFGFTDPTGLGVNICDGECNENQDGPAVCGDRGTVVRQTFFSPRPGTAGFYTLTEWAPCSEGGGIVRQITAFVTFDVCVSGVQFFLVSFSISGTAAFGCFEVWRAKAVLDESGCVIGLEASGNWELESEFKPCPDGLEIDLPSPSFGPCRDNPLP
jgi:hypothetical protein